MIQQELSRRGLSEGWPKSVDELEARIVEAIEGIPRSWYRKSFKSLPKRWKNCVKLNGDGMTFTGKRMFEKRLTVCVLLDSSY